MQTTAVRLGYFVASVLLVAGLPVVLSPFLPTSYLGLTVLGTLVFLVAVFAQARWLNGDRSWDLGILLTRDAWRHPWATRRKHLA
jgi:hypothetical protein